MPQTQPNLPMAKALKITDAQKEDIKRRYLAGETISSLASRFHCDTAAINYHLRKMGVWRKKEYTDRGCSFPGCMRRHCSQGYCHTHYCQLRRLGELKRFTDKPPVIPKPTTCDHSTSACDCRNPGQESYKQYLRSAGIHRRKDRDKDNLRQPQKLGHRRE